MTEAERAWALDIGQPEQEPVAWIHIQGTYKEPSFRQLDDGEVERGWKQYPLYNSPPAQQGLNMTLNQITEAIKREPLTRLKSNTYDAQLVEAVRQDILQLIAKLDEIQAR